MPLPLISEHIVLRRRQWRLLLAGLRRGDLCSPHLVGFPPPAGSPLRAGWWAQDPLLKPPTTRQSTSKKFCLLGNERIECKIALLQGRRVEHHLRFLIWSHLLYLIPCLLRVEVHEQIKLEDHAIGFILYWTFFLQSSYLLCLKILGLIFWSVFCQWVNVVYKKSVLDITIASSLLLR